MKCYGRYKTDPISLFLVLLRHTRPFLLLNAVVWLFYHNILYFDAKRILCSLLQHF